MCLFFFNDPATTEIYTLSLHDALPISLEHANPQGELHLIADNLSSHTSGPIQDWLGPLRSEEHTSELQSLTNLVCRPLLEKKNLCLYSKICAIWLRQQR